jgi:hypothetical protein
MYSVLLDTYITYETFQKEFFIGLEHLCFFLFFLKFSVIREFWVLCVLEFSLIRNGKLQILRKPIHHWDIRFDVFEH